MKDAIVLCSGGLDSVVTAHYAKKKLKYSNIIVLFFNYGQKSLNQERKCAKICARNLKAEFKEMALPELRNLSTSLINKKGKVKRVDKLKDTSKESKKWYVPGRNPLFIAHALSLADSLFIQDKRVYDIFLGFKCEGRESFPDATKDFLKKMNALASSYSKPFKVIAPFIEKDKEDIIVLGNELKVDFRNTSSCYVGKNMHCGSCLACMLRKQGFYWANIRDPTQYQ
ncbi:7-cyano-7-deazaguanine synthase [Candidatus Pacearchaeota archaeon]|nr:7-cyano-7-deazaguanine synthase [Candidatus Pacearchaeota archaeon]